MLNWSPIKNLTHDIDSQKVAFTVNTCDRLILLDTLSDILNSVQKAYGKAKEFGWDVPPVRWNGMKFKVGDIVRQTKPYCYEREVGGGVLVVVSVKKDSPWPYAAKIINSKSNASDTWVFAKHELESAGEYQLELGL